MERQSCASTLEEMEAQLAGAGPPGRKSSAVRKRRGHQRLLRNSQVKKTTMKRMETAKPQMTTTTTMTKVTKSLMAVGGALRSGAGTTLKKVRFPVRTQDET